MAKKKTKKPATAKKKLSKKQLAALAKGRKTAARNRKAGKLGGKRSGGLVTLKLPTRRRNKKTGRAKSRSATVTLRSGKRKRSRKLPLPKRASRLYVVAAEKKKHRKSAKRSAAAKKAARTRKRNASMAMTTRRHTTHLKSHKRSSAARKAAATRRRNAQLAVTENRRHSRRRGGSRRRSGALENPLSGVELFVGSIFGLGGFAIGDLTDRLIATHPLTDSGQKDANGNEIYTDTPASGGSYPGLFNPTAICAPMNLWRWANAIAVPGVTFLVAHYVKAPVARSSMQFFAFGYGVRGVGKGLLDGLAKLTSNFKLGQRLYDGEMRASVLKANDGNSLAAALHALPSAGLGAPPCECKKGVGWPSMPREVAPGAAVPPPPAPAQTPVTSQLPAPPLPPPPAPPPAMNLTGVPRSKNGYKPFGGYER